MNVNKVTDWRETSEVPAPGPSEIHVWRINLARPATEVARLQSCLSAGERERAARFHFAHDQRRFIIRRASLRHLLAACLKTSPAAVRLETAANGKPVVFGQNSSTGLRFSCSHSADLALVAISRGIELGVDLEQHRRFAEAEDLAKTFFADGEISELAGLPPAFKMTGFFNCWTRKEAFVKAVGLGLFHPLNRFSVSLAPDKPAAILTVADDSGALEKWSMVALDAAPDYSAALVFEGKKPPVKFFEWRSQPPGKSNS